MRKLILILTLLAMPVWADSLPSIHAVTGVQVDDALNVRAEPTAKASVIGRLAGNATGIEVVQHSADGRWARINLGESSGWVSLRYLSAANPAAWPPQTLQCFGTEPFWSLSIAGQNVLFDRPGETAQSYTINSFTTSSNRTDRFGFTGAALSAVITAQSCSDGMSDRQFGIGVDLLFTGSEAAQYSGCCTLAP